MGEAGTSAITPAVTNAIYAATGTRVRRLPVGDQAKQL
jgi:isoquinoline 1-oxidoreductase beta subunit